MIGWRSEVWSHWFIDQQNKNNYFHNELNVWAILQAKMANSSLFSFYVILNSLFIFKQDICQINHI